MSQSDLIGCDDFVLRYSDGAECADIEDAENDSQLALQWEADTGLPPDQMPLLDTGRVAASDSSLWFTLAGMSGNKPFIWGRRIAGRPLKRWEVTKLMHLGGCENLRDKTPARAPKLRKKRGGFAKINEKKRVWRDERFWRTTAYILKSIRRGWRRNPLTLPDVFRHACKAIFGTVEAYANRSQMKVFRERIFKAVMLCQAAVNKSVNNSQNTEEKCYTPKNAPAFFRTRAASGTPTGVPFSEKEKTLQSSGSPLATTPPAPLRGAVAEDRESTPLAPSPPSLRGRGAGAELLKSCRKVPAAMVGLARSVVPALREEISETQRRDAGFERWCVGWLAFWLHKGRNKAALVSAVKNEFSQGWRGGMLRERLQSAASNLCELPARRFVRRSERIATIQWRRRQSGMPAQRAAEDAAKVADYRRRMAAESDPAMRECFRRALERLTGAFLPETNFGQLCPL